MTPRRVALAVVLFAQLAGSSLAQTASAPAEPSASPV